MPGAETALLPIPRLQLLYAVIERMLDNVIVSAVAASAEQHKADHQQRLLRWKQSVMMEVEAIVDEQRLVNLLSQVEQLSMHTDFPLVALSPPGDDLRDEIVALHQQEKRRLEETSEVLAAEAKELMAEVSRKRELLSECQQKVRLAIDFAKQSRAMVENAAEAETVTKKGGR